MFKISRARKSEISGMFGTAKYVGPTLGTYSSQNEMIYDKLAHMSQAKKDYLAIQTHIICEPVILKSLHVLSCHCMLVSHSEPFLASELVSYIAHHNL
jgi:hypothetical protein